MQGHRPHAHRRNKSRPERNENCVTYVIGQNCYLCPRLLSLIVSDIEAARNELLARGVKVSEAFHHASDVHAGTDEPYLAGRRRVSGPDPERRTYNSYASFGDPDGNGWLLQEITARLPGRVEGDTTFTSSTDLAAALRRAAAAHGEHEKRNGGQHDVNWPDWYAAYIVAEQAGKELPL
jgi:hypothetical protein